MRNLLRGLVATVAVMALLGATVALTDTRPNTFDEFSTLPLYERSGAFQTLTPAERGSVVQEHLIWIASTADLTSEQAAFVTRIRGLITPETYAGDVEPSPELANLCATIAGLFTEDEARLFSSVGNPVQTEMGVARQLARSIKDVLLPAAYAAPERNCWCNTESACQCGGFPWECGEGDDECEPTSFGCGCLLFSECDAQCVSIIGG